MFVFVALMALIQVYVFSQLNFWAFESIMVCTLGYLLLRKGGSSVLDVITASIFYGFVIGIFQGEVEALRLILSIAFASLISGVLLKLYMSFKARKTMFNSLSASMIYAFFYQFIYWTLGYLMYFGAYKYYDILTIIIYAAATCVVIIGLVEVFYQRLIVVKRSV